MVLELGPSAPVPLPQQPAPAPVPQQQPSDGVFDVTLNRAPTGGIGLGFNRLTPADTSGPFVVQQLIAGAWLSKAVWFRI